jgi:hypothetical protein
MNSLEECPICTKPIPSNIDNVKTPCGHSFCFGCIVKWIVENSNSCPLCRTNIYQKPVELDNPIELEELDEESEEEPMNIDSDDEYTDDGVFMDNVSWHGDPYADDRLVELSDLEMENLINTRNKAKYIIRRLLYCKYFFSKDDFDGRIYHSLIERNQYLNYISYGEGNFYEIVIKKDNGVYDLDCHENNYFGYFEEDFYVTNNNNNIKSYFFVFNTFDPRNIDEDFYSLAGNLKYERLTINFKNIRRIYHIWPGYSC